MICRRARPAVGGVGRIGGIGRLFGFVVFGLAASALCAAEPPVVTVKIDPPHLLVGDRVQAELSLHLADLPAGSEPRFPDWSSGWGEAEVVAASPVVIEGAEGSPASQGGEGGSGPDRVAVQRLTLTAFAIGKLELPPVEITWGESGVAMTPSGLTLEVRSVLSADDRELAPAPPAPPRALPVARSVWIATGVAAALALAAGILAWRRKYTADSLAAPQLLPFAELERALGLIEARAPEVAFRSLSTALRRYLGRSLDFRALEGTTTEIQRRLIERGLERELVQRAIQTLRLSDQVKFARRPATADEAGRRVAETRAVASAIEQRVNPEAASAAAVDPTIPAAAPSPDTSKVVAG